MKKIFDIAKDSEQSWGTLATAIDGNFEDTAKFLLADKIPCGDNLITQPAELSEGWSYENGIYTHTSGYDNALVFSLATTNGRKYLAKLTKGIEGNENSIQVGIGNKTPIDTYNGNLIAYIGMISDGGSLKVYPSAKYASTLEIELYEVVDKSSASQFITYGRQNIYINLVDSEVKTEGCTVVGYEAGYYGNQKNTYIGYKAGRYCKGSNNIMVGANGGGSSVNQLNNVILLGNNTKASKDGQMILGSTAQTEVILLGNKKLIFNEDGTVTWEQI